MNTEIMIHINQDITEPNRQEFMQAIQQKAGVSINPQHQSEKPHLLFVTYDATLMKSEEIIQIAKSNGVDAQIVDL